MFYLKERKIYPLILASLFILVIPVLSYCADPKNTDTAQTGVTPIVSEGARQSETGRDIFDLSVELMTSVHGEQTFDVIDSDETLISRLKFPHRGQTMVFKGELYVLPRLSLGGRFCSSRVLQLSNANSTDTDWKANTFNRVWTESSDDTKTEINFFDANIYARLLNLEKGSGTGIAGKASDFLLVGQDGRLSFDLFGGYQFQEGRYEMCDMTQTVENYIPVSEKINSHDSFYKITYRGPRLGARGEYSFSRFSARLSFAYAWLKTKASAYWNLRDYPFYQHGDGYDGYGVDLNAEFKYQFTKHISGGFGYNYMIRRQHKMKESGDDRSGTGNYTDSDNIRNANSTLYGPSVFVKVNW